jgi:hypothetical protein
MNLKNLSAILCKDYMAYIPEDGTFLESIMLDKIMYETGNNGMPQ